MQRISFFIPVFFLLSILSYGDNGVISRFILPFKDKEARYFFSYGNTFYFGEESKRTLYRVKEDYTLMPVDDMAGWYVLDAFIIKEKIYYCSRQRILTKENNKVKIIPVVGSVELLSLTADNTSLYLLDRRGDEYYIIRVSGDFKEEESFKCPGREPSDILCHDNALWVYDIKCRGIIKYDLNTHEELFTLYTGTDNSYSKGFVFYHNRLYVHNRGTSSLDLVEFKEGENAVFSLPGEISYEYKIENKNLSNEEVCKAEFRIPVPADFPGQAIKTLTWISTPDEMKADYYGQELAYFKKDLAPGSYFLLSYRADITSWAVMFKIKEMPLESLTKIPGIIQKEYLVSDPYFSMDSEIIKKAAIKARIYPGGKEPQGVKELVENITGYVITNLSYNQDDTWEKAEDVFMKKEGSCSEYSFLFSALARLNMIPTRLIGGFITDENFSTELKHNSNYSRYGSSFHRWTEIYYPGNGWVTVDVTAIDASDPDSYDFEFFFGKPRGRIALSLSGSIEKSGLGIDAYGYKYYRGGKREREYYIETISDKPLYQGNMNIITIPAPHDFFP
ncbi:MAG: transglutaminase domain-containing protein [Spirochaetales bacterium]|nr:transglutaminase domain-containing protein [Spirochaetales bacterium]